MKKEKKFFNGNFQKCLRMTFGLLLSFILAFNCYSQTEEVLDNKKVVELTKSNLGDELIIGLFSSSTCNFDCSISSIVQLKKDGVSEKVISEMMKRCDSQKNVMKKEMDFNNPSDMHEPGIYFYVQEGNTNVLRKLYTTVITGSQSGGFGTALAQHFTYGLAKASKKSSLDGVTANVKGKSGSVFYFYFEGSSQNSNLSNWWFTNATSPNEFALIKLEVKDQHREFKYGTSDAYTSKTGVDEKQKIPFTFEEIGKGIFKVTPKNTLTAGEYCFIYSATVPTAYTNDKVFDFSINY